MKFTNFQMLRETFFSPVKAKLCETRCPLHVSPDGLSIIYLEASAQNFGVKKYPKKDTQNLYYCFTFNISVMEVARATSKKLLACYHPVRPEELKLYYNLLLVPAHSDISPIQEQFF